MPKLVHMTRCVTHDRLAVLVMSYDVVVFVEQLTGLETMSNRLLLASNEIVFAQLVLLSFFNG